ncbi:MAG TPA: hypothetical protein VE053_11725 [Allosphingosinicella sp.]|nr:hypothetical protein [Allosphingosinicella sp.]
MASPIRSLALLLALMVCSSGPGPFFVPAKAAPDEAGPNVVNCPKDYRERFNPGPISSGPLRFEKVVCLDFQSSPFSVTDAILSPDGTAVARWHGGAPAPVEIVQLSQPGRVDIPNRVTFRGFAFSGPGSSPHALAWSSDSRPMGGTSEDHVAERLRARCGASTGCSGSGRVG